MPAGPSAVPVAFRDVDLFGHPVAEVPAVLEPGPHPGMHLPPAPAPAGYLPELRLSIR
ncbi:hypothetical protein ACIA98_41525 [Streptomyces sp. NPDC051366]|uniref:hypothetical protein n=1 Tax=Streptomyces sp. NPDC051366 TaxID=3365652 RepID=UPI00379F2639